MLGCVEWRACCEGRPAERRAAAKADALRLYERAGFVRIPPFGEYVTDPTSICMEKVLTPVE